jgi:uncharacterized membrane protein
VAAALIALHQLAATFWVGGMAFALLVLRPAGMAIDPAPRLGLWRRVLGRFLPAALAAVIVLLVTGYALMLGWLGGFAAAPVHVHVMHLAGLLMSLLFLHLFFAPWRRFRRAVDSGDLAGAREHLESLRKIVGVNLALGVLTLIAGTGRYWR